MGAKTLQAHPRYVRDAHGVPTPDPAVPPPAGRLFVAEKAASAGGEVATPRARVSDEVGAVSVSNGIGFSPDGRTLYYVDSPAKCVFAFDVDDAAAALSNKRVFSDVSLFAPPGAVPDGLAVDAEGCVWVALWDGGAVARLSTAGALLATVQMPVSRPTSLAFGAGRSLYITSCSFDVGDDAPLDEPLAGAVFLIDDVGVAGAPVPRCRI